VIPRAQFKCEAIQAVGSLFLNLPHSLRALKKADEPSQLSDCSSLSSAELRRASLCCCAVADAAAEREESGERKGA